MFQNGISRNTKCAERDGFRRAGHIYIVDHKSQHVMDGHACAVTSIMITIGLQEMI